MRVVQPASIFPSDVIYLWITGNGKSGENYLKYRFWAQPRISELESLGEGGE